MGRLEAHRLKKSIELGADYGANAEIKDCLEYIDELEGAMAETQEAAGQIVAAMRDKPEGWQGLVSDGLGAIIKAGEIHTRLHEIMTREFGAVHDLAAEKKIDMRTAAYVHALSRIGQAIESTGTQSYFSEE